MSRSEGARFIEQLEEAGRAFDGTVGSARKYVEVYNSFPQDVKKDHLVLQKAMEHCPPMFIPDLFSNFPKESREDPQLCITALNKCDSGCIHALFHKFPQESQRDPQLCITALNKCHPECIHYLFQVFPQESQKDPELCMTALNTCSPLFIRELFERIPKESQKDPELCTKAIEKCYQGNLGYLWVHLIPDEAKRNPQIQQVLRQRTQTILDDDSTPSWAKSEFQAIIKTLPPPMPSTMPAPVPKPIVAEATAKKVAEEKAAAEAAAAAAKKAAEEEAAAKAAAEKAAAESAAKKAAEEKAAAEAATKKKAEKEAPVKNIYNPVMFFISATCSGSDMATLPAKSTENIWIDTFVDMMGYNGTKVFTMHNKSQTELHKEIFSVAQGDLGDVDGVIVALNSHGTKEGFYTCAPRGRMDEVRFKELESWIVAQPKFQGLPKIQLFDCCLSEAPTLSEAKWVVYEDADGPAGQDALSFETENLEDCKDVCRENGYNGFTYRNGTVYFWAQQRSVLVAARKHVKGATLYVIPRKAISQDENHGRYVPGKDCLRLFATSPGELSWAEEDGAMFSKRLRDAMEALVEDKGMVDWDELCMKMCELMEKDREYPVTPDSTGNKSYRLRLMPGNPHRVAQGGNDDKCKIIKEDGKRCWRLARRQTGKCALHQKISLDGASGPASSRQQPAGAPKLEANARDAGGAVSRTVFAPSTAAQQRTLQLRVPVEYIPGTMVQFTTPDGNVMRVILPEGLQAGGLFTVQY